MRDNYTILNQKVDNANKMILNHNYKDGKALLLEYLKEAEQLYAKRGELNYSFRNITEFYIFIKLFKIYKNVSWINLLGDEAYRILAYVSVEEKKYDEALMYLKRSLRYNPVNLNSFFEIVEVYKMTQDLTMMKKSLDDLYEYLYSPSLLSRYYRNLGFYYVEMKEYELAFSLYLISLDYDKNDFALSEMVYIRKILDDPKYIVSREDAIKNIKKNGIKIGISNRNIGLLKELSTDPKIMEKNPNYANKLKEDIKILTKN